jgi:hypothetical protein
MPDINAHFDHIGSRLAGQPSLARLASRSSVTMCGGEIVVKLAGRNVSIRPASQGLRLGSDEIDLGGDGQEQLELAAWRPSFHLTQMDG